MSDFIFIDIPEVFFGDLSPTLQPENLLFAFVYLTVTFHLYDTTLQYIPGQSTQERPGWVLWNIVSSLILYKVLFIDGCPGQAF